jgi:hypothetical protein
MALLHEGELDEESIRLNYNQLCRLEPIHINGREEIVIDNNIFSLWHFSLCKPRSLYNEDYRVFITISSVKNLKSSCVMLIF